MSTAIETTRRSGRVSDRDFLYHLLVRALRPHIEATYGPWDEQWQRARFLETTEPARHEIIEVAGEPIGAMLVEERDQCLELHRILLLPEYQSQGIGGRLMRDLLSEAARGGRAVRLQVFRVSPAVRFYERLGFARVGETETHVTMEHSA